MADEMKQLQSQLEQAAAKSDWKAVIELGSQLKKAQADADRTRAEANKDKIVEVSLKLRGALINVGKKFEEQIVELVGLDKARIKFEYDFSNEMDTNISITKGPIGGGVKRAGGGTAKKYEKSTNDMLAEYGEQAFLKNGEPSGQTLKQAYDSNTEGNWRFKVRQQLIKLDLKS